MQEIIEKNIMRVGEKCRAGPRLNGSMDQRLNATDQQINATEQRIYATDQRINATDQRINATNQRGHGAAVEATDVTSSYKGPQRSAFPL